MRYTLALLALAIPIPADAHDWYPMECCHQMDCAPVDHAETVKGQLYAGMGYAQSLAPGTLIVTTRHGTAVVPPDMQRRESKDNQMHACLRAGKVICIFLPPSN